MTLDYRMLLVLSALVGVWLSYGVLLGARMSHDPIRVVWRVWAGVTVFILTVVVISYWLYGWNFG